MVHARFDAKPAGVWFFDGQQWEMHFDGNYAVVACDPNGAPFALVIPVLDASGQGSAHTHSLFWPCFVDCPFLFPKHCYTQDCTAPTFIIDR
jgi:hypothetical protein